MAASDPNSTKLGRPKFGVKRFDTPAPGNRVCYECNGDGTCLICQGTGKINGQPDDYCNRSGRCIVCRGAGQIAGGTPTAPRRGVDAVDISRAQLVTNLTRYYEGTPSTADIDKLYRAWQRFSASSAKLKAQLGQFTPANSRGVHGIAWWEERAQSSTSHPEHAVSATDRLNMWLCAEADLPSTLTPESHLPGWLAGTWHCVEVTASDRAKRAPSPARNWTLAHDGTIDGHGDSRIRAPSTWRVHESGPLELLVRRVRPVPRTQKISLRRQADGSIELLDAARSGELSSIWRKK